MRVKIFSLLEHFSHPQNVFFLLFVNERIFRIFTARYRAMISWNIYLNNYWTKHIYWRRLKVRARQRYLVDRSCENVWGMENLKEFSFHPVKVKHIIFSFLFIHFNVILLAMNSPPQNVQFSIFLRIFQLFSPLSHRIFIVTPFPKMPKYIDVRFHLYLLRRSIISLYLQSSIIFTFLHCCCCRWWWETSGKSGRLNVCLVSSQPWGKFNEGSIFEKFSTNFSLAETTQFSMLSTTILFGVWCPSC